MYWVESTNLGDGLDRLNLMCNGGVCAQVFERGNEYRIVWDDSRSMWRVDRRTHVPGG
jgi:hypothetical protein